MFKVSISHFSWKITRKIQLKASPYHDYRLKLAFTDLPNYTDSYFICHLYSCLWCKIRQLQAGFKGAVEVKREVVSSFSPYFNWLTMFQFLLEPHIFSIYFRKLWNELEVLGKKNLSFDFTKIHLCVSNDNNKYIIIPHSSSNLKLYTVKRWIPLCGSKFQLVQPTPQNNLLLQMPDDVSSSN